MAHEKKGSKEMLRKTMFCLCVLALSVMMVTTLQAATVTYLFSGSAAGNPNPDVYRWIYDPANPNVGIPAPGLGQTGATFAQSDLLSGCNDMEMGADGDLYVASPGTNEVWRVNANTGEPKGVFLSGIERMSSLNKGPDGNWYITRYGISCVERYGPDGTPMPAAGQGGAIFAIADPGIQDVPMADPDDCAWGPDGYLYVVAETSNGVYRYNPTTGVPDAATFAAGPDIWIPTGLLFAPDGFLYVASVGSEGHFGAGYGRVLKYNGTTGEYIGTFSQWCFQAAKLALGPNGNLYCGRYGANPISQIDIATGNQVSDFAPPGATMQYGVTFATMQAVAGEVDVTVTLSDYSGDIAKVKSCKIDLLKGDGTVLSSVDVVPTSTTVEAKFMSILAGTYSVRASALKWLPKSVSAAVTAGNVTPVAIGLVNGDVNGDGAIGLLDLGILKKGWGKSST